MTQNFRGSFVSIFTHIFEFRSAFSYVWMSSSEEPAFVSTPEVNEHFTWLSSFIVESSSDGTFDVGAMQFFEAFVNFDGFFANVDFFVLNVVFGRRTLQLVNAFDLVITNNEQVFVWNKF